MLTKHFFKTLLIFTSIIALGLFGVFWITYLDSDKAEVTTTVKGIAE